MRPYPRLSNIGTRLASNRENGARPRTRVNCTARPRTVRTRTARRGTPGRTCESRRLTASHSPRAGYETTYAVRDARLRDGETEKREQNCEARARVGSGRGGNERRTERRKGNERLRNGEEQTERERERNEAERDEDGETRERRERVGRRETRDESPYVPFVTLWNVLRS